MHVETLPSGTRLVTGISRPLRFTSPCGESDLALYKRKCPFKEHQSAAAIPGFLGWQTVRPTSSQYHNHRLIIPKACWPREEVRTLGGRPGIAVAVRIAMQLAQGSDFYIAANVGIHGAQSQAHGHWHFMVEPDLRKHALSHARLRCVYAKPKRLAFRSDAISVFAGGTSPGQCVIVPVRGLPRVSEGLLMSGPNADPVIRDLPVVVERLVLLGAEKFKSEEGVSPDYSLHLQFVEGEFHSGCYTPALKPAGAVECASAVLWKRQRIGLAWSHDEIAAHLRQQ